MHEQSAETKTNLVHADTLASTEAEVLGAFKGLVDVQFRVIMSHIVAGPCFAQRLCLAS